MVEDVAGGRSGEQHECPRCGTHHADNQLRRRAKTQSWEEAVEKRSEILASKRNAGDGFDDVAHYTDLEEQIKVDVSHTEDAPEMRGNAARDGELLESHEANADLHRPATNTGTDREEVVDAAAESGVDTVQTDKGRQPHQRTEILEAMASEELERHHTSVELDLTDPDNLYEDSGCIRLSPLSQSDLTQSIYEVTPYVSTELEKIVDKLTPLVIEAAQKIAAREDRPVDSLYMPPEGEEYTGTNYLVSEHGISGGNHIFANKVISAANCSVDEIPDAVCEDIKSYGSGQSPEDKHLDGLRRAHVALLQAANITPSIQLVLDGPAWTDVEDCRVFKRFFKALEVVSKAVDIELLASPFVVSSLERRIPDLIDEHNLTDGGDGSRSPSQNQDGGDRDEAYRILQEMNSPGAQRIIANTFQEEARTAKELGADEEIDLAEDTVYPYVRQLEKEGFLEITEYTTHDNEITLSQFGKVAKGLITPSYELLPPEQQSLPTDPYQTPKIKNKYSVSDASKVGGGGRTLSPEEWLATTGDASDTDEFVQWMDGSERDVDAYSLHKRHSAAIQGDGITLLDAPVHEMDDPRVTHLSLMQDRLHVVTQWGGSKATLGRIAGVLSSPKIWKKALTEQALEDLLSDLGSTPEEVLDFVRRGIQVGWLDTDSIIDENGINYVELRNKLCSVGRTILGRLSDDFTEWTSSEWSESYGDPLGLITSMTALLDHVGIETSFHLRFPDTSSFFSNDTAREDFIKFLEHTAPKQARYGTHSAFRQVVEDRAAKLKYRKQMEIDPTDRTADLTASWVIAGEGMDQLTEELLGALRDVDPREAVKNGDEDSIGIEVPVHTGGTMGQARRVVRDILNKKNWNPQSQNVDRISRVLMSVLSHKPGRVSPYFVADALLGMGRNSSRFDVDLRDLRAGLARISEEDIYPTLKPTISKMTAALLQSDGRLEAAELVESADISRRSYENHIDTLRDLDIFARDDDGWFATLEPWWAPRSSAGRDEPPSDLRTTDTGDTILVSAPQTVDEVVGELSRSLAWRGCIGTEVTDIAVQYAADYGRQPTAHEWVQHIPDTAGWLPVIESLWLDTDQSHSSTQSDPNTSPHQSVRIGQQIDTHQKSLDVDSEQQPTAGLS